MRPPLLQLLILIASVTLGLFVLLHPFAQVFAHWKPLHAIDICGDPLSFDGFIPFSDRFICVLREAAKELQSGAIPDVVFSAENPQSSNWNSGLFSSIGLLALIAVEDSRVLSGASFAIVVTLAQWVTLAVAVPLIWIPSFILAASSRSRIFRKIHLASVHRMNRIALAVLLLILTCAFLDYTPPSQYFFVKTVLSEYLPTTLPLLWASYSFFKLHTTNPTQDPTTLLTAQYSSTRATQLFNFLAILSFLQYSTSFLLPFAIQRNPIESFPPLLHHLLQSPPTSSQPALLEWFSVWEWTALVTSMILFVTSESLNLDTNPIPAVIMFLLRAVVMGPGASLMVFVAWREEMVMMRVNEMGDGGVVDRWKERVAVVAISGVFVERLVEGERVRRESREREELSDGSKEEETLVGDESFEVEEGVGGKGDEIVSLSTEAGVGPTRASKKKSKKKKGSKNKSKSQPTKLETLTSSDKALVKQETTSTSLSPAASNAPHIPLESTEENDIDLILIDHTSPFKKRLTNLLTFILLATVIPFTLLLTFWTHQIGHAIPYCNPSVPSTSWIQLPLSETSFYIQDAFDFAFPTCIACPEGAVCVQDRVVGCVEEGWEVFGDEGLGPLSVYIGLAPVCLDGELFEKEPHTDSHFNPRIKSHPLPLSKRFRVLESLEVWVVKTSVELYYFGLDVAIGVKQGSGEFVEWVGLVGEGVGEVDWVELGKRVGNEMVMKFGEVWNSMKV
ncbi:hypothetical protein HDU98_010803 [Podochytrium sp. JEL0797]|nr:hypothetical protein HDU98_010803 [Podochytrium sp. JEL0797]